MMKTEGITTKRKTYIAIITFATCLFTICISYQDLSGERKIVNSVIDHISNATMQKQTPGRKPIKSGQVGLNNLCEAVTPESTHWIIAQEKHESCQALNAQYPDWTHLIIGDGNVDQNRRCLYFSRREGNSMNALFNLTNCTEDLLTLAVLYGIKCGASVIYVAPEGPSMELLAKSKSLLLTKRLTALTYCGKPGSYVSTNHHFGCMPLTLPNHLSQKYKLYTNHTPIVYSAGIVQSFSKNGKTEDRDTSHYCDPTSPPLTLAPGTFGAMPLRYTVYGKDAFWIIPLYFGLPDADPYVWSFVIQRILWMTGTYKSRYNAIFLQQEVQMDNREYIRHTKLRDYLVSKICLHRRFVDCVKELLTNLTVDGFLDGNIMLYVNKTMSSLISIGYEFPMIHPMEKDGFKVNCTGKDIIYHPVEYAEYIRQNDSRKTLIPGANFNHSAHTLKTTCSNYSFHKDSTPQQIDKVLLTVFFNTPHYEIIPYLEVLYRRNFPFILYCGPDPIDFDKFPKLRMLNLTFVSYGKCPRKDVAGALSYKCVSIIADMHYNVKGYLMMSDDIVLSINKVINSINSNINYTWMISDTIVHKQTLHTLKKCKLFKDCPKYVWPWFKKYYTDFTKLHNRLTNVQNSSSVAKKCLRSLIEGPSNNVSIFGAHADVYYLPQRILAEFSEIIKIFLQEYINVEIAVTTILKCIETEKRTKQLKCDFIEGPQRNEPWLFKENLIRNDFHHPAKWSSLMQHEKHITSFFCEIVFSAYNNTKY